MFTGIITDVMPVVRSRQDKGGITLTVKKPANWTDLVLGESVATNGVCLTATAIHDKEYDCYIMPETLDVSSFGFAIPKEVNLERSLSANERFGGHFVQGHVDGIGEVVKVETGSDYRVSIMFGRSGNVDNDHLSSSGKTQTTSANDLTKKSTSLLEKSEQTDVDQEARSLVIHKGSIAINGVSLTVAEVKDNVLTVALIPHTLEHTTFDSLKIGDKVNLEFDMVGKYIVNILDKSYAEKPNSQHEIADDFRARLDMPKVSKKGGLIKA